ncbi:MAG TPA: MEDS domain-containing protein [Vicinamibacterales bacterium]|nr:MEDS domain-containing protein [Vicinamibacterales bacterium]
MSRRNERARPAARPVDWSSAGACSHAVQFYEEDGHLLDLLTRFVGTALVSGDVAVIIATKAHRDGLFKRLKANGLDVSVAQDQGRFVALDAASTLSKLLRQTELDAMLFQELVGGILEEVSRSGERRRIVAFGEMVALLWTQGKADSAIQLEQLWNEMARQYEFSLCCAYPIKGFGNRHAAPFMKICAQHSHVFTVAPPRLAPPGAGYQ